MLRSEHNTKLAILAFFSMVVSFGCKVSNPGRFETGLMTTVKHKAFVGNKNARNPKPSTPDNIKAGQEAYGHFCTVCHGLDGQTTGVPFAAKMSPPIPSLASADVQSYTDGQLQWIIANGVSPSGMPASKGILNDDEIWSIVVYLRHLPPAGSLGEPQAYSQ